MNPHSSVYLAEFFADAQSIDVNNPRSLLALPSSGLLTQPQIVAATKARLMQIANAPNHSSAQADQARFMVHSSAAKLLTVLAHDDGTIAAASAHVLPKNIAPDSDYILELADSNNNNSRQDNNISSKSTSDIQLTSDVDRENSGEHDDPLDRINAIVVSCGGWNREAATRIAPIAAAHGLDMASVAAQMGQVSTPRSTAYTDRPSFTNRNITLSRSVMDPPVPGDVKLGPELLVPDDIPTREDNNRFVKRLVLALGAMVGTIVIAIAVLVVFVRLRPQAPIAANTPSATSSSATASGTVTQQTTSTNTSGNTSTIASVAPQSANVTQSNPILPNTTKETTTHIPEWVDVVRAMEVAANKLRVDAQNDAGIDSEGIKLFSEAYSSLAMHWNTATPDERTTALRVLIDAVFSAFASQELTSKCFEIITTSFRSVDSVPGSTSLSIAEHIGPSVWSAGVLSRLTRERDLPRSVSRELISIVLSLKISNTDASFESGAQAQLLLIARGLLPTKPTLSEDYAKSQREAWEAWVTYAGAIYGGLPRDFVATSSSQSQQASQTTNTNRASILILTVLDMFIGLGPSFASDESTAEAVGMLVASLSWGPNDPARNWLLTRFDDAATPHHIIQLFTRSLVARSSAPGVDQTMVLSSSASAEQRQALRDNYASVWAIHDAPTQAQIFLDWIDAAERELNLPPDPNRPYSQGVSAATLARLNTAAWLLIEQSEDSGASERAANDIIKGPDPSLSNKLASLASPTQRNINNDESMTQWALEYLAAGERVGERRDLLARFPNSPTAAEAKILVEQAGRTEPHSIQIQAANAVRTLAHNGTIALAMLQFAPFLPATSSNNELVRMVTGSNRIPSVRDPAWRIEVRRALVQRALEVTSDSGIDTLTDDIAFAIHYSYYEMAASASRARNPKQSSPSNGTFEQEPIESEVDDQDGTINPQLYASALADDLTLTASKQLASGNEPISLSSITSKRNNQRRLLGPQGNIIHGFIIEQTAVAQLLGYVAAQARPTAGVLIAAHLRELQSANQTSKHVLSQIYHNEVTITRLWLLRFKGVPATNAQENGSGVPPLNSPTQTSSGGVGS